MSIAVENTTPVSKAVFAIADMALDTPLKVDLTAKLVAPVEEVVTTTTPTVTTATNAEEPIEDFRLRFVGEVDIDEKDEPLLKESQRRFVLFPIQYHEVRLTLVIIDARPERLADIPLTDLANVQESGSILLDSGGDGSFQGFTRLGEQAQRQ